MSENDIQTGREAHARQVLALLKVVGDLAGVSDEFIANYARAHLRYEASDVPAEAEAKLDAADVDLLGVANSAEERIVLAGNLLGGVRLPRRITGPKRLRLRWALEAAQFELADLIRELKAAGRRG